MGGDPATAEGAMQAAQKVAEHAFRAGLEGSRNETFPEWLKNALDGLFVARRPLKCPLEEAMRALRRCQPIRTFRKACLTGRDGHTVPRAGADAPGPR